MLKFKKANILQLSRKTKMEYTKLDILRQTTIERLVDAGNYNNYTKEQLIDYIINNAKELLKIMIKEG